MGETRSDTFKCVETSFWTLRAVSFLESHGGPAGRKVNQLAWVHQLPTELHSLQIPLSDAHFSPSLTRSFPILQLKMQSSQSNNQTGAMQQRDSGTATNSASTGAGQQAGTQPDVGPTQSQGMANQVRS